MKNISNISFNKIHYYTDLQFNILYYNRGITEITNVLAFFFQKNSYLLFS